MQNYRHIIQRIFDDGAWIPIVASDVRDLCDVWIRTEQPFPESLARLDLVYWMDRGEVKPYRYYAGRWKWGEKKVRRLLEGFGLLKPSSQKPGRSKDMPRAQPGRSNGAETADSVEESNHQGADGAPQGRIEDPTGAQYIHTHTSYKQYSSPTHAREPAVEPEVIRMQTEQILDHALAVHEFPVEGKEVLRAWILIHDNRMPRPHDANRLRRLIGLHSQQTIIDAIERMGDSGQLAISHLLNTLKNHDPTNSPTHTAESQRTDQHGNRYKDDVERRVEETLAYLVQCGDEYADDPFLGEVVSYMQEQAAQNGAVH